MNVPLSLRMAAFYRADHGADSTADVGASLSSGSFVPILFLMIAVDRFVSTCHVRWRLCHLYCRQPRRLYCQ